MIEIGEKLYSGKAKDVFACDSPGHLVISFRNDVTAFNAQKHATLDGKGEVCCAINTLIMEYLEAQGIRTHFVRQLDATHALVHAVEIVQLESVFRNVSAGSFAKKYGIETGAPLANPVYEHCIKSDALGDPLIVEGAITALGIANTETLAEIKTITEQVNTLLGNLFSKSGYSLIDGKLEFGYAKSVSCLMLADEFTPDSCRLWSAEGDKFDKDLFREDLGDLVAGYSQVLDKLRRMTK